MVRGHNILLFVCDVVKGIQVFSFHTPSDPVFLEYIYDIRSMLFKSVQFYVKMPQLIVIVNLYLGIGRCGNGTLDLAEYGTSQRVDGMTYLERKSPSLWIFSIIEDVSLIINNKLL